jgi:16S rRNA (cytosine967-C5)-methyltransferase
MKLYKNLVNAVAVTLQEIFNNKRYADKALEKVLKQNPQWGSRDRRFVAEGVYDITRNYRLYSELAESEKNFWFITAVWLVVKETEMPDWQEFRHVNVQHILSSLDSLKNDPKMLYSYPDWLWEYGSSQLGNAKWEKEAIAMHEPARVYLRANTLKIQPKELVAKLKQAGIETTEVPASEEALVLLKRENIFQNSLFKDGLFEVQDAGSQMISRFLDPKPGEVVIDACAGAGGKSLHLAAIMKNKGKVLSLDVEEWKLDELKKRARRAGAFNIETKGIKDNSVISSLASHADKVLLDVPCSGSGVLKRNPDAKWKLNTEIIGRTINVQAEILSNYSKMVKPGGTVVYSTCSIFPSENEEQVKRFLDKEPGFELIKEKHLMPSEGTDGFYMAMLKRK